MATNSPGKGKEVIGAGLLSVKAEYIARRYKRIDKTKGWALARIVDFWFALGAPPLSDADGALAREDLDPAIPLDVIDAIDAFRARAKHHGLSPFDFLVELLERDQASGGVKSRALKEIPGSAKDVKPVQPGLGREPERKKKQA